MGWELDFAAYAVLDSQYKLMKSIQNSKVLNADSKKILVKPIMERLLKDATSYGSVPRGTGKCKLSLRNTFERTKSLKKKKKKI